MFIGPTLRYRRMILYSLTLGRQSYTYGSKHTGTHSSHISSLLPRSQSSSFLRYESDWFAGIWLARTFRVWTFERAHRIYGIAGTNCVIGRTTKCIARHIYFKLIQRYNDLFICLYVCMDLKKIFHADGSELVDLSPQILYRVAGLNLNM